MTRHPAGTLGSFDLEDAPSMDGLRACVHCGICLPQCPTFRVLGEEMDSPRGRVYLMRAAAEARIGLTPTLARHLDLCLGCRACETACPSGVPFGQLLEAGAAGLEKVARQHVPDLTNEERLGLECVVLVYGRPAVEIDQNRLAPVPPFWNLLEDQREDIEMAQRGVGRNIEDGSHLGGRKYDV